MGIGVKLNGTSLSRDDILVAARLLEQYAPLVFQLIKLPLEGCKPMIYSVIASSIFRPCDQSCTASNLIATSCQSLMVDCDPSFLDKVDLEGTWNQGMKFTSGVNMFGDRAKTALLFDLINQGFKKLASMPRVKDAFCDWSDYFVCWTVWWSWIYPKAVLIAWTIW